MRIQKTLEKMISPVRLGWHGVLASGVGLSLLLYSENFPFQIQGASLLGSGLIFYYDSAKSFLRTTKNIKKSKENLDSAFIEPHLRWYCNRQGARTAAANYGLSQEFDSIMENYTEKEMKYKWLPHL